MANYADSYVIRISSRYQTDNTDYTGNMDNINSPNPPNSPIISPKVNG